MSTGPPRLWPTLDRDCLANANDWDAMDPIRKIVGASQVVGELQDESVSLAQIAANFD